MSYTVTLPSGVRFTLCPPGVSEGAYTVERDQYIRKYGHPLGPLVFGGNRPLSEAEIKRRRGQEYHARKKARKQESPSPASAEAPPNSE